MMPAFAATPDQLYQSWQKNNLDQPETAVKAAQDYLHDAPKGPHAHELQIWLDAYNSALASLLSNGPKPAPNGAIASNNPAPNNKPAPPAPQTAPPAPAQVAKAAPENKPAPVDNKNNKQAPPVHPPAPPPPAQVAKAAPENKPAPRTQPAAPPPAQVARAEPENKPAPVDNKNNKQAAAPDSVPPPLRLVEPAPPPPVQVAKADNNQAAVPPVDPVPRPAQPEDNPVQPAPRPAQPADNPPPTQLASAEPPKNGPPENNPPKSRHPEESSNSESGNALDNGPRPLGQSLEETLAFVADRVADAGTISFMAQFRNPARDYDLVEQLSYWASGVTIDPNRCRVSFHWHVNQDGKGLPDKDRSIQIRLARGIRLETIDEALGDLNAAAGLNYTVHAQPELYAVHIDRIDNRAGDNLYFHDLNTAASVVKAIQHAQDLCAGGR